jgi:hypothetical protein
MTSGANKCAISGFAPENHDQCPLLAGSHLAIGERAPFGWRAFTSVVGGYLVHKRFLNVTLVIFLHVTFPLVSSAAPVHVTGSVCPKTGGGSITHQYWVEDAISCVWDDDASKQQIKGTDAEALLYLGAGWVGLGKQDAGQTNLTGLTVNFTGPCGAPNEPGPNDANNGCGNFTYSNPNSYTQIAFGIKDGTFPKWAIFVMPFGDFASNWAIFDRGGYSHGTLFATTQAPPIPEPASLILLGSGLSAVAYRLRRRVRR